MTDDDALLVRLRSELERLARAGRTATYAELAALCDFPPPHRIHRMTEMLERLMEDDHAAGRPLIASLAVSRTGPLPQRGYFERLRALGRYDGPDSGPEAAAQHARELDAVFAAARQDEAPESGALP